MPKPVDKLAQTAFLTTNPSLPQPPDTFTQARDGQVLGRPPLRVPVVRPDAGTQAQAASDAAGQVWTHSLATGAGALGIGATLAGIHHLLRLRAEQKSREKYRSQTLPAVHVYPPSAKAAGDGSGSIFGSAWAGVKDTVTDAVKGVDATRPHQLMQYAPAMLAASGIGLGVGYKGTNLFLASMREKARQAELDRARQEYAAAMAGASKTASERPPLAQSFDRIVSALNRDTTHERLCKHSTLSTALAQWFGAYLAAAGGLGAYGAYRGFKAQRAGSKTHDVERAQLERQLAEQQKLTPGSAVVGSL